MGTQQQFCLRWNNHQTNMLNVFDHLLQNETLVDVTLACEGISLRAHKVVLSACSPYFQALFVENPCKHPIVILRDVAYFELKALIEFMYKGEVNVSQDKLPSLLKTAEYLKVKGLSDVSHNNQSSEAAETVMTATNNKHAATILAKESPSPPPPAPPPPTQQVAQSPPPLPTTDAGSPVAKRKKTRHHSRPSEGGMSSISDNEDCESLNLKGSPEVVESRVDLPQNLGEDGLEEAPRNVDEEDDDDAKVFSPSPVETKDNILHQSSPPHEEEDSHVADMPYSTNDPSMMVASLPSTSASQYNQDLMTSEDVTEPIIHITESEFPDEESCDEKRFGPSWTTEDMASALDAVRMGTMSMSKAASMYHIPVTTLWQRARKEGIEACKRDNGPGNGSSVGWTDDMLGQALEAIRSGRLSINKAAYTYGIPNTTLWQRSRKEGIDTSRTSSAAAHPCSWTVDDLSQALEAVRAGRMSMNKASSVYGIPSTTLWTRARRHGIETMRKNIWDQDRDETLVQALNAVRSGQVSMTQASIHYNVPYTTLWKHLKKWEYSETGDDHSHANTSVGLDD